ncbi:MAG: ComEC/Rec2 family competence protein [Bacteroidota bacterium]
MEKTIQKIPFLRIAVAFAIGIAAHFYINIGFTFVFLISLLALLAIVLGQTFYSYRIASYWGIMVHLFFVALGLQVATIYNQKPIMPSEGIFKATVLEIPQEKPNSYQTVLQVKAVMNNDSVFQTDEKIMTWFEKNESAKLLIPGEQIIFEGKPQMVSNNNNPFEFDYKQYLTRKKIYRQLYLPAGNWQKIDSEPSNSLVVFAERIRMQLLQIYKEQRLGENELQILSALTLGYKRGLDPETKRVFASAGAMHVLAVSGLHVGIVFLVLNFLLGFLRKQKAGRIIFVLLVISVLWFFAFLTGLSPSVSRAATMFSFVVIGTNIRRQVNIYNSLAASAFLLLLFNPNNLFEVGFQLSYSAVFGIVFLQPRFEKLVTFKYKISRYAWALLTVSVAAQIATFPLSVYYFNQFPTYFWISNLFVIPAVIFLIPLGIAMLALHGIPVISLVISETINLVIGVVYSLLQFIENLPSSIIEFTFLPLELVFVVGFLLSVFVFIETKHKTYFKLALINLVLVMFSVFIIKIYNLSRKELIVYNQSDNTIIHLFSSHNNYVISEKELTEDDFSMDMIKNLVFRYRLGSPVFLTQQDFFEDEHLLLKDNFICFGGRVFQFASTNNEKLPHEITPEIVIGPVTTDELGPQQSNNSLLVSTARFLTTNTSGSFKVYSVRKDGAYREKW